MFGCLVKEVFSSIPLSVRLSFALTRSWLGHRTLMPKKNLEEMRSRTLYVLQWLQFLLQQKMGQWHVAAVECSSNLNHSKSLHE